MKYLPHRTLLAIAAVEDISRNQIHARVTAPALAERLGTPKRHLESTLQALVHAHLLKGGRGPRGGYIIWPGRAGATIAIAEIVDCVAALSIEPTAPRGAKTAASIGAAIATLAEPFASALKTTTLADLRTLLPVAGEDGATAPER